MRQLWHAIECAGGSCGTAGPAATALCQAARMTARLKTVGEVLRDLLVAAAAGAIAWASVATAVRLGTARAREATCAQLLAIARDHQDTLTVALTRGDCVR